MWNIKMRASRRIRNSEWLKQGGDKTFEAHISGAEGIYSDAERSRVIKDYFDRAVTHPKGNPDRIVITIERIKRRPKMVRALPVTTLKCGSPSEARKYISQVLDFLGISESAIKNGMKVLAGANTMRGASVILAGTGRRVEADRERGVRATGLGITGAADKALSALLKKEGINKATVKEAIILASKVASCRQVKAELCVSDDPDYTTGYIASSRLGYIRIPNIKNMGSKKGGRVFYICEDADTDPVIQFMEKTPVMINKICQNRGTKSIDEILDSNYR